MTAATTVPSVTVITVVYNGARFFERTLEAVAALRYPALEYVVVDGGSTDGTVDVIRGDAGRTITRWVSERDAGIYDAMNKGLAMARGEFVWFLNAGDAPAAADVLERLFADGGTHDYYYGDTALVDDHGTVSTVAAAPAVLTPQLMMRGMHVSHQSIIVRRALAPPYDLRYRFIADQKWVIESLRRARSGRHAGGVLSRYLLGGLSSRRYGRFLLEKMRYTFDELPWLPAAWLSMFDLAKAARFYTGAALRRWRLL